MNKISKYGQLKSQLDNYARNSLLEGDPKADPQQLVEDAAKIVIRDIIELDEKISKNIEDGNLEAAMYYYGIMHEKLVKRKEEFNINVY